MLRVHHSKGGKYRETPAPPTLATTIRTIEDVRPDPSSAPLVGLPSTRLIRRWITRATSAVDDDDSGWEHLTPRDLHRTWATPLASADVDPLLVCDWGRLEDLEKFLDHYCGTFSSEARQRERETVDWL
jgi:integrase